MICEQHLPCIIDRVTTLGLYDYDDTPQQINLFVSYTPSFREFTHLRLLMLSNLHSYQTLLRLLDECQHLNSLTYLKLSSCSFPNDEGIFQLIVNNIWSLSKLTKCYFDIEIKEQKIFCLPTIISSTLERLLILKSELDVNQMNQLFDYTPRLKHFYAHVKSIVDDDYVVTPRPALLRFHVSSFLQFVASEINILFRSMPNLRRLGIIIFSELIDGHQWEQIIRNYFPKLKIFRIYMEKELPFGETIKERAERLIDSFRSVFFD